MARDAKRPQATARASSGCLVSSLSLSDSPFSDSPNRQPAAQASTVEPAQLELNGTAARCLERDSGARPGGGETWGGCCADGGDGGGGVAAAAAAGARLRRRRGALPDGAASAHVHVHARARARSHAHTLPAEPEAEGGDIE